MSAAARAVWTLAEKLRRIGDDLNAGEKVDPERWNEIQSGIMRAQNLVRDQEQVESD